MGGERGSSGPSGNTGSGRGGSEKEERREEGVSREVTEGNVREEGRTLPALTRGVLKIQLQDSGAGGLSLV